MTIELNKNFTSNFTSSEKNQILEIIRKIFPNTKDFSQFNQNVNLTNDEKKIISNFLQEFYIKIQHSLEGTEDAKLNDVLKVFTQSSAKNEIFMIAKSAKDNISLMSFCNAVIVGGIGGLVTGGIPGLSIGVVMGVLFAIGMAIFKNLNNQYGWFFQDDLKTLSEVMQTKKIDWFSNENEHKSNNVVSLYNNMIEAFNSNQISVLNKPKIEIGKFGLRKKHDEFFERNIIAF